MKDSKGKSEAQQGLLSAFDESDVEDGFPSTETASFLQKVAPRVRRLRKEEAAAVQHL